MTSGSRYPSTTPPNGAALPAQATGFVGRRAELATVTALLRASRLVTVTGTGGVGKTRLALRVATLTADRYPDGVAFVELSALRDPALLAATVATHLSLPGTDSRPSLTAVLDYLRDRRSLLILDTCDYVTGACAALAESIGRAAPGVIVLATSRQPLDAAGERTFLLHPLAVTGPGDPAPGGDAGDAVELFAQRAAAVVDGFSVDVSRDQVLRICRALDGIPLAIELATVRLRALPVEQLARQLDDRFSALTGGRRTGTARHQTLRAAIAWSYELCTPAERLLWARLSVFAGRFDLAAAETVCADGELSRETVSETISGLADKSVLVRDAAPDVSYRMLDTLREFGAEQLDARAESGLRHRFVAHYLGLASEFGQNPLRDQVRRYRRLRREHANVRAAFEYALGLRGNDSAAISIATSLILYWRLSGRLREGEYWLNQVRERCGQPSAARARVLGVRAYVSALLGDLAAARDDAEEAIELAARFGDYSARGRAYIALHRALIWSGNVSEAGETLIAATDCLRAVDDQFGLAALDVQTVMLDLHAGEPDQAIERCAQALSRLPPGERWATGYLHGLRAVAYLRRGECGPGSADGRHGLAFAYELGDVTGIAFLLGVNAFLAAARRRHERTAWLLGGSAPLWERAGHWYTGSATMVALHRSAERNACESLGDDRYWDIYARGRATPLDAIIEHALADTDKLWDASLELERSLPLRLSY